MNHPDVDQVAELLAGLLPAPEERRLREHLAGCADCARLAQQLEDVSGVLRAEGQVTTPIPEDVAHRLDSVLADELHRREAESEPAHARADSAPDDDVPAAGVTSLAQRRTRRRRALAGGLLAAAAVTVAAVGLVEMMGSGGSAQLGSAGSADVASREPQSSGPQVAAGSAPGIEGAPKGRHDLSQDGLEAGPNLFRALSDRNLIAVVARGHDPGSSRLDRAACVRTALGGGADLGSVASYAVRMAPDVGRGRGGVPGAVVLRPTSAPTEGLLVACSPRPHVVLRRGLSP